MPLLVRLSLIVCALAMNLPPARAAQDADLFDFWIGDWQLSWTNANGTPGKGRNRISKSLDGRVIEEHFEQDPADPPPLLRGRSISVLQQGSGLWRQAWADNQGGFFAFTGSVDDVRRIFATDLAPVGEQIRGQRMVFYAIKPESFSWDWEGTTDGGKTWRLLWRIEYRR